MIGRHRLLSIRHRFDFHHDSRVADLCMPGPIYNWFCVAHSIVDVLSNAAAIRASQVYPRTASAAVQRNLKRGTVQSVNPNEAEDAGFGPLVGKTLADALDGMRDAHMGVYKLSEPIFGAYQVLQVHLQRRSVPPSGHSNLRLISRALLRLSGILQSFALKSPGSQSPGGPNPLPDRFSRRRPLKMSLQQRLHLSPASQILSKSLRSHY